MQEKEANRVEEEGLIEDPQHHQEEVLEESCLSSVKVLLEYSDGFELPKIKSITIQRCWLRRQVELVPLESMKFL